MVSNSKVVRRGGARRAAAVEFQSWRMGTVGLTAMARIVGLSPTRLSQLTQQGKIPVTLVHGRRHYPVDDILAMATDFQIAFPPLRCEKHDPLGEAMWAWNALSNGAANSETAPNGRAWRLYLDAKVDPVIRRRLSRLHLAQASNALDHNPGFGLEDDASDGDGVGEYVEPATPPSIFGPIDMDKISGSLSVGFEPVPEPLGGETEY